jgi:hypothetical protein
MPAQDTHDIKGKIVSVISQKGPCLPVMIAKEAGLSMLFASAFLSELVNENRVKRSRMRVGSSPIYFTHGQEQKLENFSEFLKSKEREAFNLLKETKILKDSEQEPAIRVALRAINDFAISFKDDNDVYWKYFLVSDEEVGKMFGQEAEIKTMEEKPVAITAKSGESAALEKKDGKKDAEKMAEKPVAEKKSRKKAPGRGSFQGEKFLERIREFLSMSNVEIMGIESIGKNELVLKVRENQEEYLLIAFIRKKVSEKDIISASKKASQRNLKYSIVTLGKFPKKTHDLITALKNSRKIDEVK